MTESVAQFAERARAWLSDNMPRIADPSDPPYADRGEADSWQHVRQLQRRLYDGGFAGICFPTEYGGLGLDIAYQKAFDDESACYEMPLILNTPTFTICCPTILDTGSEEQKRQHISAACAVTRCWFSCCRSPAAARTWRRDHPRRAARRQVDHQRRQDMEHRRLRRRLRAAVGQN